MNYTCHPFYENENFCWKIHEAETEQYVYSSPFEMDALKRASFYNKGGAFAGFTPTFMLRGFNRK